MAWTETELAYMAGIIDGEGSICIFEVYGKTTVLGYRQWRSALSLVNTNLELMEWVAARFGGKVHPVKRRREKGRQCYNWMIGHIKARVVVEAIRPYLVAKRKQADLFIKFQETRQHGKGRTRTLPPHVNIARDTMVAELKALNGNSRCRHISTPTKQTLLPALANGSM